MHISSNFDSGNIRVISANDFSNIQLEINTDSNSEFLQWFHYRLQGAKNKACTMQILNAGKTSYKEGWENYQAVASYDRQTWFRVPTKFNGQTLDITHTPEYDSVYYAYFAPYSFERHQDLLSNCQLSESVRMVHLGETVDKRDFNMMVIGEPAENKRKIWVIARQHPGESMAEWFMEGFLNRLLDEDDALSKTCLNDAVFYVVPNMNPDGSYRGNLRSNAAGANLNREWQTPSLDRSPEVYLVRKQMEEIGVDLFLDIHGDEALPYNFVAGAEGNPSYSDRIKSLEDAFKTHFMEINPDFQDTYGYDKDEPGKGNLTVACNWVGETFDCLSFTIEMPFKDNADLPDEDFGWSPERSITLGASVLHPIRHVFKNLR